MLDKCIIVAGEDELSKKANKNATLLFQCLVRSTLCTKLVSERFRLSSEAFEWLIGEIENRFKQAQVCLKFFFLKKKLYSILYNISFSGTTWRDGRSISCSKFGRTSYSNDIEYFPFCWSILKECNSWST